MNTPFKYQGTDVTGKEPIRSSGLFLTKQRLETLVDGIFAIAMTLLVVNLFIPKGAATSELDRILSGQLSSFYAYAIGFLLLASFWVAHHRQFHYIRHTNTTHVWINIFMLLFVALMPFSASTIANYLAVTSEVIFAGNLLALGLLLMANWIYATRGHRLVEPDLDEVTIKRNLRRTIVAAIVMGLSMIYPERSLYGYIAILIVLLAPPFRHKPGISAQR
jgi:uncharacterized membrane protein